MGVEPNKLVKDEAKGEVKSFLERKSESFEKKDKRNLKSTCLSYVKDLVIANKVDLDDMEKVTERFFKIVYEE